MTDSFSAFCMGYAATLASAELQRVTGFKSFMMKLITQSCIMQLGGLLFFDMQRKSFEKMNCSIAKALDQVGEWWSLLIVRECTQGTRRFDEFQGKLGIARNILATRLERLIGVGILEKYKMDGPGNADGYRLTEKGEQLFPVLVALMQWGDRWATADCKGPTAMVEDQTGRPIEPIVVRSKGGKPLGFREVRFALGPGATASTRRFIEGRNERVLLNE